MPDQQHSSHPNQPNQPGYGGPSGPSGRPTHPGRPGHPGGPHQPAAAQPVLRLEKLVRTHGSGATEVHALRGIDLAVHPGELVAVMGPSGSGKSTLLTLAGGLDTPTSGRVVVEGVDITTAGRRKLSALRRRSIGYVFQDYNLIPALTAAENVALPLELDGTSARKARTAALAALEEIGLRALAGRFPDEMSGGQQQRVAIARALVGDRRLVLADEPTGALDSETGESVLALLRLRCDAGAAGILVTHEPRFAAWADRVVFLRDGSVVDETLRSHADSLLTGRAAGL
ncbi:putative ABC transport system ATP-binding protein [Streptomyces sp. 3211.6]|uniref:ABC transporter ATP-binding protein n=1 Tax=Streptomyces sp. 3211.6 TaxID=1938845 RepID=UPI000F12F293|nr:putative ABC transport system ATP-binding protein [Streptomyces sp. 3211.6]